ncbi:UNVERIFIED_CONTAM: DNA-binding MurR/RpiR family transcriptional regulator [Brevibacillus sp. OAP136]
MEILTFEQRVKEKFNGLSAGQKKIAEYMVQNLEEAALSKAFQIGQNAGASETTVIRLAYALGFSGFSEMQEKIQRHLLLQNQNTYQASQAEYSADSGHEANPFAKVIEKERDLLGQILHQLDVQKVWDVVDALIKASHIMIVGARTSHAAAYWFSYTLSTLRENVILCPPASDVFERFSDLKQDAVLFIISFPRYARESLQLAECAKQRGIKLISVTDRMLSPIGRISDITLTTEENVESGCNSISLIISLLDLIVMGINERDAERIKARQHDLEQLYSAYNVFVE